MNSSKEKFERFITDSKEEFAGWDFSYLSESGRMQEFPLTWNYYNQIRDYCQKTNSLLDMGTGGESFYLVYLFYLKIPVRLKAMNQILS